MTNPLSPREQEVARLVAEDLSDKDIAGILRISVRTVQAYLDRIAGKIGAASSPYSRRRTITRWVEIVEGDRAIVPDVKAG
ncbi:MAG: helix-turn-helix domain-containing protein [Gemmatimonadaceae bacterium]